jgi:hypothetical protein
MKITLVANGESSLQTKSGNFIDSCDLVLRMGLFEIAGYEEYVGKKTDIYVTAKWKYIERDPSWQVWIVDNFEERYVSDLNQKLNYYKDLNVSDKNRASIGIRALHKILEDYKNSEVYVKGFDFFRSGHYFNSSHIHPNSSHPVCLEQIYYNKLKREKIIIEI